MKDRYKSYRHELRQHFRRFPTIESAIADPPENMEKDVWRYLCEMWSGNEYQLKCLKYKKNREELKVLHNTGSKAFRKVQYEEYKLKARQDEVIEEGSGPLSDEQLSIDVFGFNSSYIRGLGRGLKPSTSFSGKRTRTQLERDAEEAKKEAEEQRRINEQLVTRVQSLESNIMEINARLHLLLQHLGRAGPPTST